jgi:hypothetical protein
MYGTSDPGAEGIYTWPAVDCSGKPERVIDAIEDSEVLLIDAPSHQKVVDTVPGYAAAMRTGVQKHAAAKDQRIATSLSSTAEERYLEFLKTYPSIAQRVPQESLNHRAPELRQDDAEVVGHADPVGPSREDDEAGVVAAR